MILFSNSLAVSVYSSIDNVMLGFMRGEYEVGLYSVSVKVYTILKQLVASIYNVTITRLTQYLILDQEDEYKKLLNDILNNLIFFSIPIVAGIICTAPEIISFLAGAEYMKATRSLQILSVAIFFAVLGGALANCVNLPNKKEGTNLIGTSLSAIVNFTINLIAVPLFGINGAAFTTLLAELFVFIYLLFSMKMYWVYLDWKELGINVIQCIIATIPFYFIRYFIGLSGSGAHFYELIVMIVCAIISYLVIGILVRNKRITQVIKTFRKK